MTIMIPAWQDGALQPVEKLAAHQMGLKASGGVDFCDGRGSHFDPAACFRQISHTWNVGEQLLHPSALGRGSDGLRSATFG